MRGPKACWFEPEPQPSGWGRSPWVGGVAPATLPAMIKTWIRRLGWLLLALLGLACVALAIYLLRAQPQQSGQRAASGLAAAVTIERDAHGVPTVKAGSWPDLAYGLGFVHGQDRAWQLESQRRIGRGELAEAFGATALDVDRFLRALGVRRAAEARWAWLQRQTDADSQRSIALLQAYSRGVNAGRAAQARPPEMLILNLPLHDWTPIDSLAWALMMSWDLSGNWHHELLRLRLALQLPDEGPNGRSALARIHTLMPAYPGDRLPDTADYPALYRQLGLDPQRAEHVAAALQQQAPRSGVEGTGSNNWLVAGSRSATGSPLVANDPHLHLQSPALWYLARLEAPGLKVAGGTLPGLPFVVLGQNERIAWAFTNTGPDTQDLYLEELRELNGRTEIRTPTGWTAAQVHEERIRVKGAPDEVLRVRVGRHGPLISDAGVGADLLAATGKRYGLAMRWASLDPESDPIAAGVGLNQAGSVDAFFGAARRFAAPMQNMLVADRDGHTGFIASALVPVRGPQHDLHGLAPAPGWEARYDWQGYLPLDAMPRDKNPARGWIATANQRTVPDDYPHHLSHEWALPYRQQRIEQLLQATPKHSLDSFAAMQADVHSLAAAPLLPWLKNARSAHALAPAAQAALRDFDGTMRADSAAPLIFWAWARQLTLGVFQDDLGAALFERAFATRSFRDALHERLAANDAAWCDDRRTPKAETCADQADAALTRALDELQARFGPDVGRWTWGQAHVAKGEHRPFSHVPALRPIFELRTPVGGDTYTVNVSRVDLHPDWAGDVYTDDHGPSLRTLMDVANPARSRMVQSTGQSGLPWRATYRDLLPLWRDGRYLPLWSAEPPAHTLVLQPQ
jgi:penicillin amidase